MSTDDAASWTRQPSEPDISDHAETQWARRSESVTRAVDPAEAWRRGTVVSEPHGYDCDEMRYYPVANVVLLRKDRVIVTVFDVSSSSKPELQQSIRDLEGREVDGGGSDA